MNVLPTAEPGLFPFGGAKPPALFTLACWLSLWRMQRPYLKALPFPLPQSLKSQVLIIAHHHLSLFSTIFSI